MNRDTTTGRFTGCPPGTRRKLSAEQIADLINDYQAGMGTVRLARRYNVGQSTALTYVRDAGIQRRSNSDYRQKPPEIDDDDMPTRGEARALERQLAAARARHTMRLIVAAYKDGATAGMIAAELGIDTVRVERALRYAADNGAVTIRSPAKDRALTAARLAAAEATMAAWRLDALAKAVGDTCGTDAGYTRHRRALEAPCQPCKTAHAATRRAGRKVA